QGLYETIIQTLNTEKNPAQPVELAQDYYLPVMEKNYEDFIWRRDDLASLVNIARQYDKVERFLSDMSLDPPERVEATALEKEQEKLILSTIHSAKGLEWHTVFVIHLTDGYLPTLYSLAKEEYIEEERRLFYVACTRAKHNLYLISPQIEYRSHSMYTLTGASRFITGMKDFVELAEEWELSDWTLQ
ncbi:MAG: ATP-dependent helicase, partial [Nitrospirae bacterium]|nr:ATP-dependent helicase [Nitrospirota bacterium]